MEYKIDFKHGMIDGDDKRFTHCYILELVDGFGLCVGDGRAVCNPKDNFSYEKGRRVALTKAIAPFQKETRTKIWKQYFDEKLSARMTSKDHEFASILDEWFIEGTVKTNSLPSEQVKVTGGYIKPLTVQGVYDLDNKLIQIIIDLE